MRYFTNAVLLLAATLTLTLATPIPMSDEEIQRRWSAGESEVSCSTGSWRTPGCYVSAWIHSLAGKRATIHAAQSHRDATPAWAVIGRGTADDGVEIFTTDARTMASHKHQLRPRSESWMPSKAAMRKFVKSFYRQKEQQEEDLAPVLKPKRGVMYQFRA